jgi:hypothetical protein
MSTPPRHPRDYGGRFTLKNQDDGSPIREQIVFGDRLLLITEKCIYAIQMADQIDPGRTNLNLPHTSQQKLFDHGVNSELLCRSLLHAKVMFRREFQLIAIERAMQLAFDVFSELAAMDEVARTFKAAEAAAIEKAQGLRRTDGSLALPAVGNVRAHCKTFAQRADHGAGALLDIVRLFYEQKGAGAPQVGEGAAALRQADHETGRGRGEETPVDANKGGGFVRMSRRMIVRMGFHASRNALKSLATPAGLEPATCRLEGGCSIQLSYGAESMSRPAPRNASVRPGDGTVRREIVGIR